MRLIDADAIINTLGCSDRDIYVKECIEEDTPTVPAVPLDRIKETRDEIDAQCGSKGLDDYDYCSGLIFAMHVLDKLIVEVEGKE